MTKDTARKKHCKAVEQVRIRRKILKLAMGGRCEYCGEANLRRLEFHHLKPRGWVCREKSRWSRQAQYEREWNRGILRLACSTCNKSLGKPDGTFREEQPEKVPF